MSALAVAASYVRGWGKAMWGVLTLAGVLAVVLISAVLIATAMALLGQVER